MQEPPAPNSAIQRECAQLAVIETRGDLGRAIARLVLAHSPRDLQQMRWNFSKKIRDISPAYRKTLEEAITGYLHGTYQNVRLMNQQGVFSSIHGALQANAPAYWRMVADHCATGDEEEDRIRFLKYLLSGFCMLVQGMPGHPIGMPFPGGDRVECIDGIYYCPVRTKANDVDSALCPFCPALQTPESGYLRPPVNASEHRKQEFIRTCFDHHHFNG
ncbi:MAG: DUF2115 domain-containing protein [Methanolinea sp.]|jgi:uncharacterized protein (UPF0305 family)|nr:DUF2115 domain-containing protein [Methanolinea sp.]